LYNKFQNELAKEKQTINSIIDIEASGEINSKNNKYPKQVNTN